MSRLCGKTQSLCRDKPLSDPEVCNKMIVLRQIVSSCYGPYGRLKQIHNNVGGHVQITSSSPIIFKMLQTSEPLLKLLVVSLQNHIHRFSDSGLFAALLCLGLFENVKKLPIPLNTAISVVRHLQILSTNYLSSEECKCRIKIDFCSCQDLLVLARSTIKSKPACGLRYVELHHICTLVTKAFLQTIPTSTSGVVQLGRVLVVAYEGETVEHSAVYDGILVDLPDILPSQAMESLKSGSHKVAVFSTSLSGDLSEVGENTVEVHSGFDPEADILAQLLNLGEQVVLDGVTLFMCQKVIHPILQQYLGERGVVVVERLGIALLQPVIDLTGAQALASLQTPVLADAYGQADGLRIHCSSSRQFLHLRSHTNSAVCTLRLCHRNQTMLDELKLACERALHVLRLTLKEPFALLGGGCMEVHLAAHIRMMAQRNLQQISNALGCSPSDVQQGADAYCRSLESVASALEHDGGDSMIDLTYGHHWVSTSDENMHTSPPRTCGCGLTSSSQVTQWTFLKTRYPEFSPAASTCSGQACALDCYLSKVNALNVAVEMASFLLDVTYMIRDVN